MFAWMSWIHLLFPYCCAYVAHSTTRCVQGLAWLWPWSPESFAQRYACTMVGVRMPSASNSRHFVMHLCCGFGCKHNNHNNVYQSFQAKFDCAYKYIYNKHNHVYMHVYANVCMIMHICTHITQSYPDVDVHISSSHLNLCLHMNWNMPTCICTWNCNHANTCTYTHNSNHSSIYAWSCPHMYAHMNVNMLLCVHTVLTSGIVPARACIRSHNHAHVHRYT